MNNRLHPYLDPRPVIVDPIGNLGFETFTMDKIKFLLHSGHYVPKFIEVISISEYFRIIAEILRFHGG